MWIKGKIALNTTISEADLAGWFPVEETELTQDQLIIHTRNIPFFADHKLFLNTEKKQLKYKLWLPSLGPLIFFMYLAVIFLAGFTNWRMLVVGGIIVTGIAFAIYVLNDKGARHYIHKHIDRFIIPIEEDYTEIADKQGLCPACYTEISPYTRICPECGLHIKNAKKIKQHNNHTGSDNITVQYHIKE